MANAIKAFGLTPKGEKMANANEAFGLTP